MIKKIKIRKTKNRARKFFGFPDEKHLRGCGKNGYARCYGRGRKIDFRTKKDILNDIDRKEIKDEMELKTKRNLCTLN